MKNIVKVASVNCSICGTEVLNYQLQTAKIASVLKEVCPKCHSKASTYEEFKKSLALMKELQKAGQAVDPITDSPNISIEPIDSNIQAACELLKRMDSGYFKGVSKIVAGAEANYGHTDSKEPTVVHINLSRITSEAGPNAKREIIIGLATTIAHEIGHIKSFKDGQFVGGESPAMSEEQKVSNWIKANESRLQDLFK